MVTRKILSKRVRQALSGEGKRHEPSHVRPGTTRWGGMVDDLYAPARYDMVHLHCIGWTSIFPGSL